MPKYVLCLYIAGRTQRSLRAEANLRRVCEDFLDEYELTLVDVQAQPELAEQARIFATPATLRLAPPPTCRVVGDLSDPAKVLSALGIGGVDGTPAREG